MTDAQNAQPTTAPKTVPPPAAPQPEPLTFPLPIDRKWLRLDLRGVYSRRDSFMLDLPLRQHDHWVDQGATFVAFSSTEDLAQLRPHAPADFLEALQPWYSTPTGRFDLERYQVEAAPAPGAAD